MHNINQRTSIKRAGRSDKIEPKCRYFCNIIISVIVIF